MCEPPPMMYDTHGVPEICWQFWTQELVLGLGDFFLCAFLTVYVAYIGGSLVRRMQREGIEWQASGSIRV